jgi:hypothetical protein
MGLRGDRKVQGQLCVGNGVLIMASLPRALLGEPSLIPNGAWLSQCAENFQPILLWGPLRGVWMKHHASECFTEHCILSEARS